MALKITVQKQTDTKTINITYWEITEFYAKPAEKYFLCELRGFVDKETYIQFLETGATKEEEEYKFRFSLSGADYPDTTQANWVANAVEVFIKQQTNKYGIDWTVATTEASAAADVKPK